MKYSSETVIFSIIFFLMCIGASGQVVEGTPSRESSEVRIAKLIEALDESNLLRTALKSGSRGNMVRQPWMDLMNTVSERQASVVISYKWSDKEREFRVTGIDFLKAYYDDNSVVSNNEIKRVRLDREIAKIALDKAAETLPGLVKELETAVPALKSKARKYCGTVYFNFLDDEALPTLDRIPRIDSNCSN